MIVKKEEGKETWMCKLYYKNSEGKRYCHMRRGFPDKRAARKYAEDFEKKINAQESVTAP